MRYLPIILIAIFLVTSCVNSYRESDKFYEEHCFKYLQSDLPQYTYYPKPCFVKWDKGKVSFNVVITADSSLKVVGIKRFAKEFGLTIHNSFNPKLVVIERKNGNLYLYSDNNYLIERIAETSIDINPVDYFLNLHAQIKTYGIIAIEKRLVGNMTELIFNHNDYLVYRPDTLAKDTYDQIFVNATLEDGKKLDNNWFQFNKEKNIDYN